MARARAAALAAIVLVHGLPITGAAAQTKSTRSDKKQPAATPPPQAPTSPAPSQAPAERPTEETRPWARGVSAQERDTANALLREGNHLVEESLFVQAAEKYRAALMHWDHPAIHYNLALALINLDQPLDVYEHLGQALRFGEPPLGPEKFEHAKSYRTLIEKQLVRLELSCDVRDAKVSLDGKPLFTGPGRREQLVRAGLHTIIASKEGYVSNEQTRPFLPGEKAVLNLKLYTTEDLTQYRRRWSVWKPWIGVAGGALVAGLGGGLLLRQSLVDFRNFDQGVMLCAQQSGQARACTLTSELSALRSRGQIESIVSYAAFAIGGAGIVTGAVLLYANRLRVFRVRPRERQKAASAIPLLGSGPGHIGVSASWRF